MMQEDIKYLFDKTMKFWRFGFIDWDERNEMLQVINNIAVHRDKIESFCTTTENIQAIKKEIS